MTPGISLNRSLSLVLSLVSLSVVLVAVCLVMASGSIATSVTIVLTAAELVGLMAMGVLFAVLRGEAQRIKAEVERGR
jgi:hypothetical protein